ncbi:MAG: ABC transporter ATP-binding protein [Candidatus Sungbacteria bacterium RIFCSPLOWO2_01_FULL_60_25]|uniref:ABC transporter ATP-binding protein n=1 Tax=Candidatus Sungbacteria bacterium RIFCSPLOWO2_01_FULL_60_25 TaxID=1802281 RepID=A0A1G2LCE1_9BACT|nr:MAG: ABC transporter ATP-binding protein [Candidatus Sungbacteria bacterium RIFCSPLOWO2_01_FULL_60_25]
MADAVLEVRGLTKRYNQALAVDGISFSVNRGEVVGLLGPNGAGKTTTLSMLLGVLEPTAGTVRIGGFDVFQERTRALARTNFAAIYAQVPGNLSVFQNLYIFGLLYGVPDLRVRVDGLLREFELEPFRDTKCGLLSSGEQTRVHLAKAVINAPELLLLDEPTASLDPSAARAIREKIRSFATHGEAGVLWTSHNMHEVEAVCDRVLFLSHGRVLLEGDPKELPRAHGKHNLEELFITVAREPLSLELE